MNRKNVYQLTLFLIFSFLLFYPSVNASEVVIPENTTCKKITTEYVNVLPYNGEDPGITRACIGWAPNYPSTRVEGGQGTYFYFAYKLFPVPMPAYTVTTHDDLGLQQDFTLSEPGDTLGACNPKIDADETCEMYEPFLYYPARWEDRFREDTLAEYRGPYTVGPHEFYHYRYRGRMVPKQINFHFDVIDPTGQSVNIAEAKGTIVYDVPDDCYFDHVIEIKDKCRSIQFYIPVVGSADRELPTDASLGELPASEDRIRFLNPGEHRFRVEVDEVQIYRYQVDEGAEWQGKEKVYRKRWDDETTEEIVTTPDTKIVTKYRYDEGTVENGRWCLGHSDCWYDENVYMPKLPEIAWNYTDAEGFKGPLYEIEDSRKYVASSEDVSKPAFKHRTISANLDGRNGYDYYNRGVFEKPDGTYWKSHWMNQHYNGAANLSNQFYSAPRGYKYIGYEWQRYQIVSGIVTRGEATSETITTTTSGSLEYAIGPVKTHTVRVKESNPPEIEWVNQDEYKNHCYSEEDAFSKTGEWKEPAHMPDFNAIDSPAIVCFHNHGDDFHYWEYEWSSVRKFGGDTRKGLLF